MQVKFDSLNRYEVPNFTLCNPGSINNNGLLTRVVGPITNTSDEEVEFNFNATSTLNFRVEKPPSDGTPEKDYANYIYKRLQNRRLVYVEDIGYFVITDVSTGYEEGKNYKDITASSCEIEIQNKALMYIEDGTYQFTELFERVVATIPKWTILHVDSTVAARHRTFEDVDTSLNTFAFLMEEMQEAYECIFSFDTICRTISVYDKNNYLVRTNIHLTRDDLITTLNVTENTDELYTALSVFGDEGITISSVNPLGTTTVYNFDCYLDWMSEDLRDKVMEWSALVLSYDDPYYELNDQYYLKFAEKSDCQSEIERLEQQKEIYTRCRENVVASSSTESAEDYNEELERNGGEPIDISENIEVLLADIDERLEETDVAIAEKTEELDEIQSELDEIKEQIDDICEAVSFDNYFTEDEYAELYDYIYEGTYTDDYITTTDSMTSTEKLEQMKELYVRAKSSLQLAAYPGQEFTVDVEDFVFVKEFKDWSEQLEVGCLINVELDDGDVAELFLNTIQLNWDDKSLSLTFGDRFNRLDPQALFNNVMGNIQKSSNSISYIKKIIYPVKNGKISDLENDVRNSRILSVNESIASSNGEVLLDGSGYTGRKKRSRSEEFANEQFKLTSNTVVFTEDAWRTCKTLLGYVTISDLTKGYGVNAQAVIGDLILNDRLSIKDADGNDLFSVVENMITLVVDNTTADLLEEIDNKIGEVRVMLNDLSVCVDGIEQSIDNRLASIEEAARLVGDVSSSIGELPEGTTFVELVDQKVAEARYDDTEVLAKIGANEAAIAELRASIDALTTTN